MTENQPTIEELLSLQFIQISRIYDVLMALLAEKDPENAISLRNLHAEFQLMSPLPYVVDDSQ